MKEPREPEIMSCYKNGKRGKRHLKRKGEQISGSVIVQPEYMRNSPRDPTQPLNPVKKTNCPAETGEEKKKEKEDKKGKGKLDKGGRSSSLKRKERKGKERKKYTESSHQ